MEQYYQRDDRSSVSQQNNKAAGCLLVFLMLVIVGFMVYSIYLSWKNPTMPPGAATPTMVVASPTSSYVISSDSTVASATSPSPTLSPEPWATDSGTPAASPEASASPSESPEASPSASPEESPSPSPEPSAKPSGEKSPTPKNTSTPKNEKWFSGAKPDGPPTGYDREHGDMFEGKSGKAFIMITAEPKSFKDVRAYLINKQEKTYRTLSFEHEGGKKNLFKATIPPGTYVLKLVKAGYYSFNSDEMPLEDGLMAEIYEPMEKRPSLKISTTPPGARVYVDQLVAGTTPATVDNLDAKKYKIKVVKPGYKTQELTVTFKKDQDVTKNLTLIKE